MSTLVFVDSSALIALGNRRDEYHKLAKKRFKEIEDAKKKFITTHGVILEVANTFSSAKYKPIAIRLIEHVSQSEKWKIRNIDNELMEKGVEEFKRMKDKDWSLVDCISIIISKEHQIIDVMTNDHHFEQAGFTILLK